MISEATLSSKSKDVIDQFLLQFMDGAVFLSEVNQHPDLFFRYFFLQLEAASKELDEKICGCREG